MGLVWQTAASLPTSHTAPPLKDQLELLHHVKRIPDTQGPSRAPSPFGRGLPPLPPSRVTVHGSGGHTRLWAATLRPMFMFTHVLHSFGSCLHKPAGHDMRTPTHDPPTRPRQRDRVGMGNSGKGLLAAHKVRPYSKRCSR